MCPIPHPKKSPWPQQEAAESARISGEQARKKYENFFIYYFLYDKLRRHSQVELLAHSPTYIDL